MWNWQTCLKRSYKKIWLARHQTHIDLDYCTYDFRYLAYLTWGTWWTVFWFLIYGNIFVASNPIWHETGHRTAFKSDWLNSTFYHIGSFMFNLEPIRWRWSHFNHHSHTLSTANPYDYEIQITKPTDLIYFFLLLIPGGSFFSFYKTTSIFA